MAALRAKYDPRDLSTVFLEDETGRHWPIRYRDLARPAITLWGQKAAVKTCGRVAATWWTSNPFSRPWRRDVSWLRKVSPRPMRHGVKLSAVRTFEAPAGQGG